MSASGPIHRLSRYARGRLELWLTPCIVTMPPPDSHCLVVPSNERLVGTQFSHFPAGGPTPSAPRIGVPPATTSNQKTLSDTILYACETVDGTVTEYAGVELERQVQQLVPVVKGDEKYPIRCPTGQARKVPSVGYLRHNFEWLVLTVAPFYENHDNNNHDGSWERDLGSAYSNALFLAQQCRPTKTTTTSTTTVATPLLGAGARGAPVEEAARVAATSILSFLTLNDDNDSSKEDHQDLDMIIRLCVLEEDVAEIIHDNLERYQDP